MERRINLLSILVGVTLVLTLMNTYSTFGMNTQLNAFQGQVVLAGSGSANNAGDALREVAPTGNTGNPQPEAQAPSVISVSADDDSVLGSEDAPVTIIEFSDYECPFCARAFNNTLPEIKEKYVDTGKVKLVYRDFPLSIHRSAQKAAEASECAGEQGKFWEMHDKLFENQSALDVASLKQYAKDIALDSTEFDACLDSGEMASEVQKDFSDGQKYGVTGTPAFFINGIKVSGAQPFSVFEQIIESELAKEGA